MAIPATPRPSTDRVMISMSAVFGIAISASGR